MKRSLILSLLLLCGCQSEDPAKKAIQEAVIQEKIKKDISDLEYARNLYLADHYPQELPRNLKELWEDPGDTKKPWKRRINRWPVDPWGNDYQMDDKKEVFSTGPDGKRETSDDVF